MMKRVKKFMMVTFSMLFALAMYTSVYAVEIGNGVKESSDTSVLIPKGVTVKNSSRGDYGGPAIVYTYTIAPVTPATGAKVGDTPVEIGPTDGATLANNGQVTFQNEVITGVTNTGVEQKKNLQVNVDLTKFTKPGIYRYLITDTTTIEAMYGAGLTRPDDYDATRYLDVYIKYNDAGTDLIVGGYALSKTNVVTSDASTKDAGFVRTSETEEVGGETVYKGDVYRLYNLDIYKKVTGSMGDKTHTFPFSYTVQNYGLKYRPGYYMEGNLTTESSGTFQIADGNSYSFRGLNARATITLTETNDTSIAYDVLIEGKNVSTAATATTLVAESTVDPNGTKVLPVGAITDYEDENSIGDGTTPGSIDHEGVLNKNRTAIQYVNNAGDVSPTGIIFKYGPFALMIGFAMVLLVLRRRKQDIRDL